MTEDHVGRIAAQWRRERPDVDSSPQGVVGRLHRIAQTLQHQIDEVFEAHGLGEGEFDVLASLRRSGEPYALTPGEIAASMMIRSGTLTKRLDRLVEKGLIDRRRSDTDGRGRVVTLTDQGRQIVDAAFTEHMANEGQLLAVLSPTDRRELEAILRRWAKALGD